MFLTLTWWGRNDLEFGCSKTSKTLKITLTLTCQEQTDLRFGFRNPKKTGYQSFNTISRTFHVIDLEITFTLTWWYQNGLDLATQKNSKWHGFNLTSMFFNDSTSKCPYLWPDRVKRTSDSDFGTQKTNTKVLIKFRWLFVFLTLKWPWPWPDEVKHCFDNPKNARCHGFNLISMAIDDLTLKKLDSDPMGVKQNPA